MAHAAQPSEGGIMVVVAEDEPLIRMLVVETLAEHGFTVVEAEHAEAAMAILSSHADRIHALFTDIHMPGTIDGLELARRVHERWPWIVLLMASGRARPVQAELPGGCRFLEKPYSPEMVANTMRDLLARGTGAGATSAH